MKTFYDRIDRIAFCLVGRIISSDKNRNVLVEAIKNDFYVFFDYKKSDGSVSKKNVRPKRFMNSPNGEKIIAFDAEAKIDKQYFVSGISNVSKVENDKQELKPKEVEKNEELTSVVKQIEHFLKDKWMRYSIHQNSNSVRIAFKYVRKSGEILILKPNHIVLSWNNLRVLESAESITKFEFKSVENLTEFIEKAYMYEDVEWVRKYVGLKAQSIDTLYNFLRGKYFSVELNKNSGILQCKMSNIKAIVTEDGEKFKFVRIEFIDGKDIETVWNNVEQQEVSELLEKEIYGDVREHSAHKKYMIERFERVKKDWRVLGEIERPTEGEIEVAVAQNLSALNLFKPSKKMIFELTDKDSIGMMKNLKDPSKEVQLRAWKSDPSSLKYVEHPCKEIENMSRRKEFDGLFERIEKVVGNKYGDIKEILNNTLFYDGKELLEFLNGNKKYYSLNLRYERGDYSDNYIEFVFGRTEEYRLDSTFSDIIEKGKDKVLGDWMLVSASAPTSNLGT